MPRPLRVCFPDALYHVTTRGVERRAIFRSDGDRLDFLDILRRVVLARGWLCHAYCLMDNHYHLVIATPESDLSPGMQALNGRYAQRFNRRYERRGHLFEARFQAALVTEESHALNTCRYVVRNPVRAGICRHPGDWRWSSFAATVGERPPPVFLTTSWLLGQLAGDRVRARQIFRELTTAG